MTLNDTRQLLLRIARCPNVDRCLSGRADGHPCATVVGAQQQFDDPHFVPEPWSGQIEKAPILFVSSNPSIAGGELAPTVEWSDEEIVDFYAHRFGGGSREWIRDGVRNLRRDGTYRKHAVRFWASVRGRAAELLGIPKERVRPGIDYALTEVVHCNSPQEIGVVEALDECVDRYLLPVLEAAHAPVIVSLGVRAEEVLRSRLRLGTGAVEGPREIAGRDRFLTFLPHPNAFKPKTFAKCVDPEDLHRLRAVALEARCR